MTRRRVPVARLTTPAEMVASLPLTIGFVPTESLVVLCCHEPRGRIGLSLRFDLPARVLEPALVEEIAIRVRHERATRVVLAVYTEEPDAGSRPRLEMVTALRRALDDLVVTEAVLVRDGRFWSYLCDEQSCCPREGTPVDQGASSGAVQLLAAEAVLEGRAVLPDRQALQASLTGPVGEAAVEALRRCEAATVLLVDTIEEAGISVARGASLEGWSAALERFRNPPGRLGDMEVAALAVSLVDVQTRDAVAAWSDDAPTPLLGLLEELCRRTPAPYDAPVCTLFAWLAYAAGGGARVGIALERALGSDPDLPMALLLSEALLNQVPPAQIRRATTASTASYGCRSRQE